MRMKLLLLSLGSRGDMDPFLAVGAHFAAAGWEVVCAFPEQFSALAAEAGFRCIPLDRRFYALIESSDVQNFMGQRGNIFSRIGQLRRLYRDSQDIQRQLVREQRALVEAERPDRILFHPKCVYPVVWDQLHPGRAALLLPVPGLQHPLDAHPPIVPSTRDYGRRINRFLYRLTDIAKARMIKSTVAPVLDDLPGARLDRWTITKQLNNLPALYTVSPALFTPPAHWPANAEVVGYYARQTADDYVPPADLEAFLTSYHKCLFVTFGSMVNADPAGATRAVLAVLEKHRIPAILNTFSGGLKRPAADVPDHIYFTERIPYSWIFPRMYAVIHHGGSGTTHMAARSGCAQLLVPHIFDQFYWAWKIQQHGLGPAGLPIKNWTAARLEPKLLDLWNNSTYKSKAIEIAAAMQTETDPTSLVARVAAGVPDRPFQR